MNSREKIIVASMLVALSYGIYSFVSVPSSQNTNVPAEKQSASVKALSSQLSEDLKKDSLTETERYVLERAEAEWPSDPFLGEKLSSTPQTARGAGGQPSDFNYSGYVDVGQKRLAIINGMEYQVGEQLQSGGYVVQSIDPEKVVLEDIGKRGYLILPYSGEIF
jgi:hypothetical protein